MSYRRDNSSVRVGIVVIMFRDSSLKNVISDDHGETHCQNHSGRAHTFGDFVGKFNQINDVHFFNVKVEEKTAITTQCTQTV